MACLVSYTQISSLRCRTYRLHVVYCLHVFLSALVSAAIIHGSSNLRMKERHNTSGIRPQPLAKPKPPPSNVFRTLSGTKCTPGVSRQSAVPCPASRAAAAAASPDRHDFPHSPQLQPDDAEEQQWDAGHSGGAAPAEAPAAAAAPTSTGHFARCTTQGQQQQMQTSLSTQKPGGKRG